MAAEAGDNEGETEVRRGFTVFLRVFKGSRRDFGSKGVVGCSMPGG